MRVILMKEQLCFSTLTSGDLNFRQVGHMGLPFSDYSYANEQPLGLQSFHHYLGEEGVRICHSTKRIS